MIKEPDDICICHRESLQISRHICQLTMTEEIVVYAACSCLSCLYNYLNVHNSTWRSTRFTHNPSDWVILISLVTLQVTIHSENPRVIFMVFFLFRLIWKIGLIETYSTLFDLPETQAKLIEIFENVFYIIYRWDFQTLFVFSLVRLLVSEIRWGFFAPTSSPDRTRSLPDSNRALVNLVFARKKIVIYH